MIVLTVEKIDFVLEEDLPEQPTETESKAKRDSYDKWIAVDKLACCYILALMSNVLQQKHVSLETSYDIMKILKDMFTHQSRRAQFEVIHMLQNMRMKPGTLVKDHMLTMIGHFNVAENLGATIDQDTQVDMPKGGGGKKKKRTSKKQEGNKTKADGKPEGKCFKCGQKGHWKKDCPDALAKKEQGDDDSGEQKTQ
ncbi:Gag/pol protein [Abeliophyllum distichum]|uniref:Gag/pol protein n=1 Tax=Abeliophyllum distichum TaxID=126358 RepID=A0ABD1QDJ3_9LAMI